MNDLATSVPRWLRLWAALTVLAALPLVTLGAETTTKGVGMADQVSLRSPWYFFTLDLRDTPLGLLIEHSHRLFGWAVGLCCIVLALGLQVAARGWRRWLGWAALVLVSAQGVFGILRVKWNALAGPELAAFHGVFAQLTFAGLVAAAVMLSRAWDEAVNADTGRGLSLALAVLVFAQVVFGALTRHLTDGLALRLHVFLAFAVIAAAALLIHQLRETGDRAAWRFAMLLAVLLIIQPMLGIEAWMRRFGPDRPGDVIPAMVPSSPLLDFTRSAHHVAGTLIFAAAVALAVLLWRPGVRLAHLRDEAEGREGEAPAEPGRSASQSGDGLGGVIARGSAGASPSRSLASPSRPNASPSRSGAEAMPPAAPPELEGAA